MMQPRRRKLWIGISLLASPRGGVRWTSNQRIKITTPMIILKPIPLIHLRTNPAHTGRTLTGLTTNLLAPKLHCVKTAGRAVSPTAPHYSIQMSIQMSIQCTILILVFSRSRRKSSVHVQSSPSCYRAYRPGQITLLLRITRTIHGHWQASMASQQAQLLTATITARVR